MLAYAPIRTYIKYVEGQFLDLNWVHHAVYQTQVLVDVEYVIVGVALEQSAEDLLSDKLLVSLNHVLLYLNFTDSEVFQYCLVILYASY